MKTLTWGRGILCSMTLVFLAGCHTGSNECQLNLAPVVHTDNEEIILDQLIIIVDETGSIGSARTYEYEKNLVQAFTRAMPDGAYESGIDSFAGVKRILWLKEPLASFDRDRMVCAADSLEPLGSLTPLARAIRSQEKEIRGLGGRGALLIFSDGMVRDPQDVLQACRDMNAAHGGELCIFTVHVGTSNHGKKLMQDMAAVNGCGRYYDGASLCSDAGMQGLVRDIFFGTRQVVEVTERTTTAVSWTINNILFDNDSSVIAAKYDTLLNEAVAILSNNPNSRIHLHLEGHTDHNASNEYNQGLSERRVNAVHKALVQRGADPARLDTSAFGETRPTVPNDSPEHLHMNRRVEISVIE